MKKALLLLTMCFMALSNAFGAVTWYLNEDFESGQIPSGWTQEVVSSNVANWVIEPTTSATYPASGNESNYYVALRNNTGMDQHYVTKLITPAIDFTVGEVSNPQLVFNHAQVGVGQDFDTLKVYSRANASAPWILLHVFSSRVDVWTIDTVALTGFTNASAYQIGFEAVENMGRGIVVDDVRIMNASQCVMPSGIEMVVPGTTSVKLTWNGDLMADTFEVVLSKVAIVDWSSYTAAFHGYSTDFEIEATGLEHSTTYFAYVRSNCNDNETGWTDWGMGTFRTRARMEIPYVQGFAEGLPEGWTRASYWHMSQPSFPSTSLSSYSVDSSAVMAFSGVLANRRACAITPEVNVQSLQGVEVSFWGTAGSNVKTPGNSSIAQLYVGVMNDPEDSASLVIVDSVEVKVANKHQRFDVSLAGYNGNGLYLAFLVGNPTRTSYFYLDSLVITRPNAFVPAVKLSNATPDGFDVNVDLKGASSWNLRIARAADYKHKNVLPSSFILSQDGLTGNTFHVSGNYGDSIVAVYVQGVSAAGTSAWSFPVTLRVPGRATLPLAYEFDAESEASLLLKSLDNEFTVNSTAKTYPYLYFPLNDSTYFYPMHSSTSPKYNNSTHMVLQGIDNWITLPYIDSFDGQMLSFHMAAAHQGESRVAVGIMSDPYDAATFTQLAVFEGKTTYIKCEQDLEGHDNLGHYVAIKALRPVAPAATGSVNHIDALHVVPMGECREVLTAVAAVRDTLLSLSWQPRGMNHWYVELFDSTGNNVLQAQDVNVPNVTFTGLQILTNYWYRINTFCGADTLPGNGKIAFRTPCSVISEFPWAESFNSLTVSGAIPQCWDNEDGTTTNSTHKWCFYSESGNGGCAGKGPDGSNCIRFDSYLNGNNNTNFLKTPALSMPADKDMQISFWYKNPYGGDFSVYVSLDGGLTYSTALATNLVGASDWTPKTISLSAYKGQDVVFVFAGTSNYGYGDAYIYLDQVEVEVVPTCIEPTGLTVSNVTGNSASATWTAGENETQWEYVCVAKDVQVDWSTATRVNTPAAQLSGLSSNRTYNLYVRSYCSADDQSKAIMKTFATACGVISEFPWQEGFEAYDGGNYDSTNPDYIPLCWDMSSTASVLPHVIADGAQYVAVHTGTKALAFYGSGFNVAMLPRFDVPLNTLKISFWYGTESSANGTLQLGYFEANDTVFHAIQSYPCTYDKEYVKVDQILTGLPTSAERLAFQWYFKSQYDAFVDDIVISQLDLNCTGLASLRAAASSPSDATIYWTAGGTQLVDIEISDSASFVYPTQFLGTAQNPVILTNLEANHLYYVRGRQSCDQGGDWMTVSFKTLCGAVDPLQYGVQDFESADDLDCWIVGVGTAGVRTTSDPSISSASQRGHYLYFNKSATSDTITYGDGLYAIMPMLDVDSITHYDVVFNAFKTSNVTGNKGTLSVGVITDPSDFSTFTSLQTLSLDYAADELSEKSYTVSFANYMGDYNDEFGKYIMFYTQSGDSANAVGVDNVEVAVKNDCPQIVEGRISAIEQTQALYSWEGNGAAAYEVVVMTAAGNPDYSDELPVFRDTVTTDSALLSGLSPATIYYAYVRSLCNGGASRWSAHSRFQSSCGIISNLPWSEDFESYAGSTYNSAGPVPTCWISTSTGTQYPHVISSGSYLYTHNGSASSLSFYGSGDCYAALPEFSIPLNMMQFSFWYQTESSTNGELTVGYISEHDTAMETFEAIESFPRNTGSMTQVEMSLENLPAEAHRLVFLWSCTSQWSCCIDDVVMERIPSCKPLAAIVPTKVSRRYMTVQLMPKPGDNPEHFELVCSPTRLGSQSLDSVAKIDVDSTGIATISGLDRETLYYLYARVNCGQEDGVSEWLSTTIKTKALAATDSIIIADGTIMSEYFPVYGFYADAVQHSQSVYPESMLAELVGTPITGLTYYISAASTSTSTSTSWRYGNGSFEVSLGTTQQTSLASGFAPDAVTNVYTGTLDASGTQMHIELSTPFVYNGGNLLVDFNLPVASGYERAYFIGADQAEASFMQYDYYGSPTGGYASFIPKVALHYAYAVEPCPDLTDLTVELLGDGTSSAVVRWNNSEDDYMSSSDVIVSDSVITDFTDIVPTITAAPADSVILTNLNSSTTYYVYVRATCMADGVDEGQSGWAGTSFTTLANCPAVVGLMSDLKAANAISVSWATAFADQALAFAYVYSTDTLSTSDLSAVEPVLVNDTRAFELTDLLYDQTYHIYVASVCGETVSPWSHTSIKTDPACAPVRNLTAARIEKNRVILTWNASRFGSETEWEAGILGDSASIVVVSGSEETLTTMIIGLEPETQYTAYVRTLCANGEKSEMATLQFTTKSAAGGCATVGSGSSSSSYVPTHSYYNYSFTQQIYTPAEIGQDGTIQSIAFFNSGSEKTRSLKIYLSNTSKDAFTSIQDWVTVPSSALVYSGSVTFTEDVWTSIPLSSPFRFTGSDNLLVTVVDETGSYSEGLSCATFSTTDYQALYKYNDNTLYDITSISGISGTRMTSKNQMQFCFQAETGCTPVANLKVSDVSINSAVASWEPTGSERSWQVYLADTLIADFTGLVLDTIYSYTYPMAELQADKDYIFYVQPICGGEWKAIAFRTEPTCPAPVDLSVDNITSSSATLHWNDAFSVGTGFVVAYGLANSFNLNDAATFETVSVDADSLVISGLSAQTYYAFAVKPLCGATSQGRYSEVNTFRTNCGFVTAFPWTENFEAMATGVLDDPCWENVHVSGTGTNLFKVATNSSISNDTHVLQLPDQAGGTLTKLRLPAMTFPDSNYQFVLDVYRSNSTYNANNIYEGVRVFVSTDGELAGAREITFIPRQYNTADSLIPAETAVGWYTYELPLHISGDCYIILQGENQYCTSTYLDNFIVQEMPACPKPGMVTVSGVVGDRVTFSWTAGANETQWQYICAPKDSLVDWTLATLTSATSATVNGLSANSAYTLYVRSYCSATEQSEPRTADFVTPCGISLIPFRENFNSLSSNGQIPNCWDNSEGTTTNANYKWCYYSSTGNGNCAGTGPDESNCIRFESYANSNGNTNTLASPAIYLSEDARLSFAWKNPTGGDASILIGLAGDTARVPLMSTGLTGITDWTDIDIPLFDYTGDTVIIYFSATSNYGNGNAYLYMDNVAVVPFSSNCTGLGNFHMAVASTTSAQLEWTFAKESNNNAQIQVAADADFTELLDSATLANVTSYTVFGLEPANTYYARGRQLCGEEGDSEWSRTVAFTTSYGIPFIPQFSSTTVPSDWMRSNTEAAQVFAGQPMATNSSGWSLTSADTVINSTHFRGNIYGTSWHYWVVTPSIDMTENVGQGIILSVDAGLTAYSTSDIPNMYTGNDDRFLVAVSGDGGATWDAADIISEWNNDGTGNFVYNDIPTTGQTYRLNLSDYTGKVVKIGFYGESTISNADNYFHFGNIRLETAETVTYLDTICEGYSFNKNGFSVPYDQLHVGLNAVSRFEYNADGTLSLTIQQIWVNAASVVEIPVTLCEGEHYNDYGFDVTATVSQNVRKRIDGGNQFGCDSTVILQMTVIPTVRAEIHVGCNTDSYTWHGKTYYQSTIVDDTTSSLVTGCDSITTLYLTMCEPTTYSYFNAFCEGGSYSDEFFDNLTMPGHYSTTVTDELGCETHANVTLRALKSGQNYVDSVHVSKLPYVLGNDTLCPETDQPGFVYHGSKDFGCGLVNVTIYVYDKVALDNIAAGTLQVAPNPVRIGEDIRILTSIGFTSDYSCRVFDAVGKLVYESFEPAKTIPGLPVAGAYTIRISAGNTIYQGKLIVK